MSHRFHSGERLKSRKEIGRLFTPGTSTFSAYPIRVLYRRAERRQGSHPYRVSFVVPKRKFKRAVDRNLLKRRMVEAYRLNKHLLAGTPVQGEAEKEPTQYVLLLMYTGREAVPYATIERKVAQLLQRLPTGEGRTTPEP